MTKSKNKKFLFTVIAAICLIVITIFALPSSDPSGNPSAVSLVPKSSNQNPRQVPEQSFNKNLHRLDEASSLWVIVNKGRVLPAVYVPSELVVPKIPLKTSAASAEMHVRADTAVALETMAAAAAKSGITLKLASGYRSYALQQSVYAGYVSRYGTAQADTFSARPGHSEHQTGLAADLEPVSRQCEVEICFKDTAEGKWLAANCYKYGFIIRYQANEESETGYQFEPWHVRYVGASLAAEIKKTGQALEEFFGLEPYSHYPAEQYEIKNI